MTTSALLAITELAATQQDRAVTVNEAIAKLETAAGHVPAKQVLLNTPPGSPAEGDTYVAGTAPTGAWAGQANKIARYENGAWIFLPVREGLMADDALTDTVYRYSGSAWSAFAGPGGLFVLRAGDTMSGALQAPAGTVAAPGLAVGAANDGFYRIGAGNLGFTFGGVQGFRASADGIGIGADPTSSAPLVIQKTGATSLIAEILGESAIGWYATRYSADTSGPANSNRKARGTIAAPAAVAQNDTVQAFDLRGHDGTVFRQAVVQFATIRAATPSSTDMESRLTLNLVPAGSGTAIEFWRQEHATGLSMFGANVVINANRHFRKRQYAAAALPSQASGDEIASSDIIAATLVSDGTQWLSPGVKVLNAVTANTTISIPAGWAISQILFANTTANAVSGGIRIGTTSGAADVVNAQAVGANAIGSIDDANILLKIFSRTAAQTLFIQAVTAWNSASVELSFVLRKVF